MADDLPLCEHGHAKRSYVNFFRWIGLDGTFCVPNVFITFKRTENIALLHFKRKKKNLIYLNSYVGRVCYCFLSFP